MHIISNGSTNVFPNNALTKFTNVLPNTFETLKNEAIDNLQKSGSNRGGNFKKNLTGFFKKPKYGIAFLIEIKSRRTLNFDHAKKWHHSQKTTHTNQKKK